MAAGATDARLVQGGVLVLGAQWVPAGSAQLKMARLQVVADRNPLVKHKALALPTALCGRHGFKVLQDAAFEMVDLIEALGAHEGGRFFAADAAGAEHGHPRLFSIALGQ